MKAPYEDLLLCEVHVHTHGHLCHSHSPIKGFHFHNRQGHFTCLHTNIPGKLGECTLPPSPGGGGESRATPTGGSSLGQLTTRWLSTERKGPALTTCQLRMASGHRGYWEHNQGPPCRDTTVGSGRTAVLPRDWVQSLFLGRWEGGGGRRVEGGTGPSGYTGHWEISCSLPGKQTFFFFFFLRFIVGGTFLEAIGQ